MSSTARELRLCVSTMVPRPPQFLLEGVSSHSIEVPTHVEFSEACAGFVLETTGTPGGTAPETHEDLPKDDDIDDWDYELDVTDIPILDPNWDPSMENPDDPRIPFDDLMEMMQDPLACPKSRATPNQGNPLFVSASIALNEGKNELPTPSHPLLDSSMPHKEMGISDKPSSQPSGPAMTGQGDPSPMPNPGVTNNDEGGSFAPLPPALDLPAAAMEAEVPAKPSKCLSVRLLSLYRARPNSFLSPLGLLATPPRCLHIGLPASGLDQSPQALEVLEAQLAALRSEAVGTGG
ncbi:hypothetical protein Taro_044414 [Colocasia esculenta]|uniref:Uncharacterized protein n=1 Tax=Colocasia esculenta TaxID=4460 RepID=A0A843WY98_COLES|nr:hypothetical protein [Colocasia esculenta]